MAEIGYQPRAAASVTPLENGATAVDNDRRMRTLQGLGQRSPVQCLGRKWRSLTTVPVFTPRRLSGGSPAPDRQHLIDRIQGTWHCGWRSRLPNTSASDSNPPGLMPKMKPAIQHVIEHCDLGGHIGRMIVRHVHRAGAELDLFGRVRSGEPRTSLQEVMFSA